MFVTKGDWINLKPVRLRSLATRTDFDETIGIIFPVLPKHSAMFFDRGKRVFVKFVGRAGRGISSRLGAGSKLFFYQSGGGQEIIGEARIVNIKTSPSEEVFKECKNSLFLSREELEAYVGQRRDKEMLVLVLDDIIKYQTPLRFWNLTMAGQYMTKRMLHSLQTREPLEKSLPSHA